MQLLNQQAEYKPNFSSLQVRDLSLQVQLGCTANERATRQEVRISIDFRFANPPAGAMTDSLEDTICYAQVSSLLQEHCESREFNLIERIGLECFGLLKQFVNSNSVQIALRVHKVNPPVPNLRQGTHFVCGDFAL
jgi:dihydroneopterin aldolase